MRLDAMAVMLPEVAGHPNRAPFTGVLTLVDEPSTRPPSGARGHRVILTREAALAALPSLLGMAVDYVPSWDGHDARRKCGIITHADLEGAQLRVAGYLFARDFPEVERQVRQSLSGSMGMSWELADAHVEDMRAEVWTLTRATFTGAAILLREKAAYRGTSFALGPLPGRPAETLMPQRCRPATRHSCRTPHAVHAGTNRNSRSGAAASVRNIDRRKETTWKDRQVNAWAR